MRPTTGSRITQSLLAILVVFGVDVDYGPLFKLSHPVSMVECHVGKHMMMNIKPAETWLEIGAECFEDVDAATRFGMSYVQQKQNGLEI